MSAAAAYARSRARATSAPDAVTVTTRPPFVTMLSPVVGRSARVEHDDTLARTGGVESRDDVSLAIGRRRIAAGREHHADARRVRELDGRPELAGRRLREVHEQVTGNPRHEHLALRVAEPDVVLEHLRARRA